MSSDDETAKYMKISKVKIVIKNKEEKEEIKQNSDMKKTDFEILTEHVKNFINEKLLITTNREDRINLVELLEQFNLWFSNKDKINITNINFGKAMKKNRIYSVFLQEKTCYLGLKYKI